MPLSDPAPREPMHHRRHMFDGYRRGDGLWDIEGRIVDTKTYTVPNRDRGGIAVSEPVREMAVRLTLDESLTVRAVEAAPEHAPYAVCPGAVPTYQGLVGARIGPGWRRSVHKAVGRDTGCTHITELIAAMGTAAIQTMAPVLAREGRLDGGAGGRCYAVTPGGAARAPSG